VVLAGSIALHLLLLALLLFRARVPRMVPAEEQIRLTELPPLAPGASKARSTVSQPSAAATPAVPAVPGRELPQARVAADTGSGRVSRGEAAAQRGGDESRYGRIGPAQSTGKVWVAPLPLPPQELAARLTRSHSELADSAVTAIIQAFLDSIATDPATRAARPPDWTTTVGGARFGLDSKWIYVAGLKIPTALLGLLPMPAGGNDQQAFDRSADLYRDLRQAAQRAQNTEDFKKAIKEIRERKEAERQFQKNQRTPPPPDLVPEEPPQ
jgi:hypothetical protein